MRWAAPLAVVSVKAPNDWLTKGKAPSPPVASLTTVRLPRCVFSKVQTTGSAGPRSILAGLPPSEQVATAHRLASELLARKATATTPKARRKAAAAGLSPAQISNLAAKLAAALTETPSLKSDPKSTPGLDALRAVLAK